MAPGFPWSMFSHVFFACDINTWFIRPRTSIDAASGIWYSRTLFANCLILNFSWRGIPFDGFPNNELSSNTWHYLVQLNTPNQPNIHFKGKLFSNVSNGGAGIILFHRLYFWSAFAFIGLFRRFQWGAGEYREIGSWKTTSLSSTVVQRKNN